MTNHEIFIIGDGDNIRRRIEQELLSGSVVGCRSVSAAINAGMACIESLASSRAGWKVVFCGGDDILITSDRSRYDPEYVRVLIKAFLDRSGSTICFGAASSLERAFLNLRRAKAKGAGMLVCETE